jgi:hypothetical protein
MLPKSRIVRGFWTCLAIAGIVATNAAAQEGNKSSSLDVQMTPNGKRVEIKVGGKLLTEYIPDDGPKPYFYPLIGPSGASMTRSFPMKKVEGEKYDHPHHRSLWFTHGSVNKVDFWSEVPGRSKAPRRPGFSTSR